eukprot:scaffold10926_cov163-Amphora_coffeaeformis.AAC.12
MVATFRECEADDDCHFMFHHPGKTGGTTLEDWVPTMLGIPRPPESCCNNNLMKRFGANPHRFCNNKFQGYQASSEQFAEAIRVCNHRKVVVLTTFREPAGLLLSAIHQTCNKNKKARDAQTLAICRTCRFENHTDFWMTHFPKLVRAQLSKAWNTSELHPHYTALWPPNNNEDDDESAFISAWKPDWFQTHNMTMANEERNGTCNFFAPSALLKELKVSNEIYRQLVAAG